jgi:hypothetical protein
MIPSLRIGLVAVFVSGVLACNLPVHREADSVGIVERTPDVSGDGTLATSLGAREGPQGVLQAPMTWKLDWPYPSGRWYPRPPAESRVEPLSCGRWAGPFATIGCEECAGLVDELPGAQLVPKRFEDMCHSRSWMPAGMTGCPSALTFQGTRPRLVPVPAAPLLGGSTFEVHYRQDSPTDPIAKAVLLRPGCLLHSVDFEQRYVELECEAHPTLPSTVRVTVPGSGEEVAAGDWMLFLVTQAGVPSEASFVHFQR